MNKFAGRLFYAVKETLKDNFALVILAVFIIQAVCGNTEPFELGMIAIPFVAVFIVNFLVGQKK